VLVDQVLYQGEYQVTVSSFKSTPQLATNVPAIGDPERAALAGLLLGAAMLRLGRQRPRATGPLQPR
jgi:hypothetical protein